MNIRLIRGWHWLILILSTSLRPSRVMNSSLATGVVSQSSISNIGAIHKGPIADVKEGEFSAEETRLRNKLACLYRLIDLHKWSQSIYNHITVRVPSTTNEEILINPFGKFYNEITARSLVKVDLDGKVLHPGSTGYGINQAGYVLHSAIHKARPDVAVVVHLHIPAVVSVASLKCGLLPLSQEAMILGPVAYHDYQGILVDAAEKESLAQDLGDKNIMLLRNHGFVICSPTIETAFLMTYHLILACETQIRMMSAAKLEDITIASQLAAQRAHAIATGGGGGVNRQADGRVDTVKFVVGELEWEAYMRAMDNMGLVTGHQHRHTQDHQ